MHHREKLDISNAPFIVGPIVLVLKYHVPHQSKIESITAHGVTYTTTGHVASSSELQLVYSGSLAINKWLSLVDSTLNNNHPCEETSVAAALADDSHSGVAQAGVSSKIVTMNTATLNTTKTFAVCYAENSDYAYDSWYDSDIRLEIVPEITCNALKSVYKQHTCCKSPNPGVNILGGVYHHSTHLVHDCASVKTAFKASCTCSPNTNDA